MVGKHHAGTRPRRTWLLAGAVLAALVLAGATAALWPRGDAPAPASATTPHPVTPAPATPDRDAERPSRGGETRAARPQTSPSEEEPAPEPAPAEPDAGDNVVETGSCGASFYWEPQPTASGEVFDPEAMTAAHKTWDFDTRVRVTNAASGDSVVVRINDRGPYIDGRCLDLARGAFREIAALDQGVVTVTYEVLSD